ncbi:hypothetical protein GCM10010349_78210 [Streptomyces flavofungini]|nr:hypothetical protein GCM10010349_78210 [Streptomyces flavofungini]
MTLSPQDQLTLDAKADVSDLWEDGPSYGCQLRGAHPGRHVALIDHLAWDEDPPVVTYWLWWDAGGHTLTHASSCSDCHLPQGHPVSSGCSTYAGQCAAAAGITDSDRAMLEDLEDAVHEAETHHRCQYTAGHDGPHVRLAQSQDRPDNTSTTWWVCWPAPHTGHPYTLTVIDECPATAAADNDDGLCLLPAGHPGNHQF